MQKRHPLSFHCKFHTHCIICTVHSEIPSSLFIQVFELGVVLQPSSSEALCHLGNGQLTQYDTTNEDSWLKEAELSFRASIAMEGKAISPSTIPNELKEQEWWKKRTAPATSDAKKPTPTAQKQPTAPASKQPPTRGKPAAPQGAKNQPAARQAAKTANTQPAAKRPTGPATRQPSGAAKPGPVKPGPAKPGQRVTPIKPQVGGKATHCEPKTVPKKPQQNVTTPSPTKPPGGGKEEVSSPAATSTDSTPAPPPTKAELNKQTYHPRLGLARTLAKFSDAKKHEESHSLYRQVIKMSPQVHDAYIELGEMLAKSNPVAAVEVYAQYPFSDPPSFDDAFLHGEIVNLLMKSESYDAPQLCTSLVAMGKALGIGVLEKQVTILEGKFKTGLLKKVYAGVHGKPLDDPELQAFFKFKCWM